MLETQVTGSARQVEGGEECVVAPAQKKDRPRVASKFLFVGNDKLYIRGTTYGTFAPDENETQFPSRERVRSDFALMAANGFNSIRTYTVPPRWLLDVAHQHGLRVMVGMPWEQHIAFLAEKGRAEAIEQKVREGVRACAGHPAVLCYGIGNEIPSSIVRWHGQKAIERFLERLYYAGKAEDPDGLFTYVNYPSTEYLRLPFLDLFCFNVYLEKQNALENYLARLHNLAGDRPVLLAEIGLDSQRNGFEVQARTLDWQIRSTFSEGCIGAFIFAWTDEWYRGGHEILDWDFGLTKRDRTAKPALESVARAFAEAPFNSTEECPLISVIVCTYNGSRTLRQCLEGLQKLNYPNYEVIVVNDGSTDHSSVIALDFKVRLISTENRGLSSARNTGLEAATGEFVVYIDDDAYPDPDWLAYVALSFKRFDYAAVGGPNVAPVGDGMVAECVVNAPGGPVQVLLNDREAEHIPGCNMAFRKECLTKIGGFDPEFRVAGDDVDVCWRILQMGWKIGFSPGALVWHHRRNSLSAYWRQQRGYGKAEALLERKWPEKYNSVGHIKWAGRLYGRGLTRILFKPQRIYHGAWGRAPFQTSHEASPTLLTILPTMPEWYLIVIALAGLSALAFVWPKLTLALPLFLLAISATAWQSVLSSRQAVFPSAPRSPFKRSLLYTVTALLHLVQPLARLGGRVRHGLTAWRRHTPGAFFVPFVKNVSVWSEVWHAPETWLEEVVAKLRAARAVMVIGGDFDRWEVEVRGGILAAARLRMVTEEHGAGRQLLRFRLWPRFSWESIVGVVVFMGLSLGAALDQYWIAYDILAIIGLFLIGRALFEAASAMAALREVVSSLEKKR
jgi:O-antigen biosynthesis protein